VIETDVLVIGGGGAAARAAVEAARKGVKVVLADKGRLGSSGTSPQGLHGFVTALPAEVSEETLFSEFVRIGYGINDFDLVRTAVEESSKEPALLEELGLRFVRDKAGHYFYRRTAKYLQITFDEAGCGLNPVAVLGREVRKHNVHLVNGIMIIQLLVKDGCVFGAVGLDRRNELYTFAAKAVVLAAGGANRTYPNVVPRISPEQYRTTGDGLVLALASGLPLVDVEFAQFRNSPPAATINAKYINAQGEHFMARYDPQLKEDAPRSQIVEAIFREIEAGRGPVYIDLEDEGVRVHEFLKDDYKEYVRACKGGNPQPVTITFQRLLGGVRIHPDASTAVSGLFVAGENAGGLHGADRVRGSAFLETQVFGRLAGIGAAAHARKTGRTEIAKDLTEKGRERISKVRERKKGPKAGELLESARQLTWTYASIIRDGKGLKKGLAALENIKAALESAVGQNSFEVFEACNLARVAEIVMRAALAREETRGSHRRADFPQMSKEMDRKHIQVRLNASDTVETKVVPSRA